MKYLKDLFEFILALFYFPCLKLNAGQPFRIVIYYHDINEADIVSFRKQMDYLARSCKVVKPSEIMTAEAEGSKNIIAITFDDAFAGVKEHAIPVLREFGLPAGIFVPAGRLGQKSGWEVFDDFEDANGMVINEEQILELDKDGFEIFSHTYSHPVLTEVNDGRLEVELVESKNLLEGIVGHEILAISYPYGAYDARICEAAERYGYKLGFTIEPDMVCGATRCLEIGRFSVSPQDSLLKFKLKNNGAYQVAKYLRCLKKSFVKA